MVFSRGVRVQFASRNSLRKRGEGKTPATAIAVEDILILRLLFEIGGSSRIHKYVERSEKDKRSSYAPEKGYRYDGVDRVEKCWRKAGKQGFKVCRYLFVRSDNEPAPWTSDEHGDSPRPLPDIPELYKALDIFERAESPSWDYDEQEACWKWKNPPPASEEKVINVALVMMNLGNN